jgi:quercetin dioxygenase-like cupin family protein
LRHRSIGFCPFCAPPDFSAGGAGASAPTGLSYEILARIDGPTEDFETVIATAEVGPDFDVPRHLHPGIESAYIVAGGGLLLVEGAAPRELRAGDVAQIPARRPHSFRTGGAVTRIVSTYVLERGQPLSIPV